MLYSYYSFILIYYSHIHFVFTIHMYHSYLLFTYMNSILLFIRTDRIPLFTVHVLYRISLFMYTYILFTNTHFATILLLHISMIMFDKIERVIHYFCMNSFIMVDVMWRVGVWRIWYDLMPPLGAQRMVFFFQTPSSMFFFLWPGLHWSCGTCDTSFIIFL